MHLALKANDYEPWMSDIPTRNQRQQDKQPNNTEVKQQHSITLQYIKGISEPLDRIFKKYDIRTYHKPFNTLRQQLVHPKDPTQKHTQKNI